MNMQIRCKFFVGIGSREEDKSTRFLLSLGIHSLSVMGPRSPGGVRELLKVLTGTFSVDSINTYKFESTLKVPVHSDLYKSD